MNWRESSERALHFLCSLFIVSVRNFRGRDLEPGGEMSYPIEESAGEANEGKNGEGTTVVVGVKVDDDSRELLTWALVNVAQAGDRVIALHVLPAGNSINKR